MAFFLYKKKEIISIEETRKNAIHLKELFKPTEKSSAYIFQPPQKNRNVCVEMAGKWK
jgi:hypothetical protein